MAAYTLESRFWNCFWMAVLIIPALPLILALVALIVSGGRVDTSPSLPGVLPSIGLIIMGVAALAGLVGLARRIHEVRVTSAGMVTFARTVGRTTVPARTIRLLEGKYVRGYDGEEWVLEITHAGGRVRLDAFAEVRDFAERIEALNPAVGIFGTWPMGPP